MISTALTFITVTVLIPWAIALAGDFIGYLRDIADCAERDRV